MSNSSKNEKTATEQPTLEAQAQALIAKFAPAHVELTGAVRQKLRKRLPGACEIVYEYRSWFVISYSPNDHGYEGVLGIRGDAEGVKLFFNRGKELPDPQKLLKGSGRLVRSVDLEDANALARPAIVNLIGEAIARNPIAFGGSGHGSTIVRSASAKTKRTT
ncbi:hypothetical protein [Arenimonas sp.]|uniref:hypothetical protein n=1 Tax=Arenimonas sp. TaxID=1872635 RepID=UPI0039E5ADC8